MRVLITGVAGFIGSHLADKLTSLGHSVFGVDTLETGRAENVNDMVAWERGDCRYTGSFFRYAKPDVVVHCAASYKDPDAWQRDIETNAEGTAAVARWAREQDARLVYFQTALCYGTNPYNCDKTFPLKTSHRIAPDSSYAISKTAGERYIQLSGVDFVSLRLANIFGPRNLSGPIPTFYKRIISGQPCTVVNSRRDFVFIDDLIDVALLAVYGKGRGVYHVSSGRDFPIYEVYNAVVGAACDESRPATVQPRSADDAPTILLDPSATEREFEWKASTPLLDGIRRAVEWYRENGVGDTYTHLSLKG